MHALLDRCQEATSFLRDICPNGCHMWPWTDNPAVHAEDICPVCDEERYEITELADGRMRYTPRQVMQLAMKLVSALSE